MSNWEAIKNKVEDNQNIYTINMSELRDAAGKEKLGIHVRSEISKTLAGMGLGHIPTELPQYQHEPVRIYKRGTPIGELMEMVMTPGESNDRKLKEQLEDSAVDHATILEKIRELVSV
ncbi:MAG: hypothetical protein V4812_14165 [Pseudomonadota bacterium]